MKTLLKNGKLIDKHSPLNNLLLDILIEDGIILKIERNIQDVESTIIDLDGSYISAGFIDSHLHCFPLNTAIGCYPDEVGIYKGVTTVIDAGTSGADTIDEFYNEIISKSTTRVFTLLNIAKDGLKTLKELNSLENINRKKIHEAVNKYPQMIVGLKARASGSVVGDNGILPIALGKKIAQEVKLPLVVHIGNAPPSVEEVLDILENGDVITHCYNNKANGLVRNNSVIKEVYSALEKGVIFDVGHGTESFSFDTGEIALKHNFEAHIISTDLYERNLITPVQSLETTINKMLYLGLDLETCIDKVTRVPAEVFNLEKLGSLKIGYKGDITIFDLVSKEKLKLVDSVGKEVSSSSFIKTKYIFIKDRLIKLPKE